MYWTMALLPFALLMLGFPIFLLLLVTSFVVMIFFFPVPLTAIHLTIFNSLNKYALLAVPFFIFAGDLMSRGGISTRLLRWVASLIGGFRGSIPMTSLGFAALNVAFCRERTFLLRKPQSGPEARGRHRTAVRVGFPKPHLLDISQRDLGAAGLVGCSRCLGAQNDVELRRTCA